MRGLPLLLLAGLLAFTLPSASAQRADCATSIIDLAFLVDGSGSICDTDPNFNPSSGTCDNWNLVLAFMVDIVDKLAISDNQARVGLVTFANEGITRWNLTRHTDSDSLKNAIRTLGYPGGNTNTADGLDRMLDSVFNSDGDRPNVRNVAIVITDGLPTRRVGEEVQLALDAQEGRRGAPVVMFAVGVTIAIDEDTLRALSSTPRTEGSNWFRTARFGELTEVLDALTAVACATPTPATGCAESVIDIAIAVDVSGSICNDRPVDTCDNWELTVDFMESIASALGISRDDARMAVVRFGSSASVEWYLDRYEQKNALENAIRDLQYRPGETTNTYDALRVLRTEVFNGRNGDRANVRNVVIIITDGIPILNVDLTEPEAERLQEIATVFSVGVTQNINEDVLRYLASQPRRLNEQYFTTPDFDQLQDILQTLLVVACGTTPQPSTTPSPVEGCRSQGDVCFIIDVSGSIGDRNFETMRTFLTEIVSQLDIESGRIRVCLIVFSDNAELLFQLDRYSTRAQIQEFIANVQYTRGTTNTAAALDLARNQGFRNGDRSNIPNIAVVMTDGGSNEKERTVRAAIEAKKEMFILTIGIGSWVDEYELRAIASDPYQENFWPVERFEDLFNFQTRLRDVACNNVDECRQFNPCRNGGTCVDGIQTYYCICPFPWAGQNCEYRCRVPRDVVFTLDASGSIGKDNFQLAVDFAKDIARQLPIERGTNVGLITFGDNVQMYFRLDEYQTRSEVLDGMTIPFFSDGTTNTAGALQYLREQMFTQGNNPDYPDLSIIITDGRSNDMEATWRQAIQDRNRGIHIMAVGVGNNVRMRELVGMASYPTDENVFTVSRFEDLTNIVNQIRDAVCDAVNECNSNPCRNGGTCRDVIGGYYCECPRSFTGVNCERGCPGEIDICFIIDKSGSVRHERFEDVKNMISQVVDRLEIWNDKVRVAAISFSDDSTLEFDLDDYSTKPDIQEAIYRIRYSGGRTNIASALQMARDQVFQSNRGDRQDAPDFIVIFTDGGSNIREDDTVPQAILDKIAGMHITAAAVGRDLDMMELRSIASPPEDDNVYTVDSFSRINELVDDITGAICNDNDECRSSPCRNGGTCVNDYFRYICICPTDRTGEQCERTCRRQYDIAFVMDLSGSVDSVTEISKTFVREMIYGLEFRFDTVRAALVSYSDESRTNFLLTTYRDKPSLLNALAFGNVGGRTNTQDALRRVRDEVFTGFNGDRSGVRNKVILLTDGGSNINPGQTISRADDLKRRDAEIHVVAIGDQVDMNEINGIASESIEPYVYRVSDRQGAIDAASRLLDELCN